MNIIADRSGLRICKKTILTRREVEGLIADGRNILVVDGEVLKVDAWLRYHPGGDKAIMHMVGRDATDEVNALHSAEARQYMSRFRIGRIDGRWRNFLPPIQGGHFKGYTENAGTVHGDDEDEVASSSGSSSFPTTPIFDPIEDLSVCERRRRINVELDEVSSVSSFSSIELPAAIDEAKLSLMDARTRQEIDLDLAKYPALDPATQDDVVRKYRLLYHQLRAEKLFDCNYTAYAIETCRYTFLFGIFLVLLRYGWYGTSGLFLGMCWHQLVFTVHDAGHMGITHDFTVDTVIGIIIADFVGGLSLGWWKRSHNVHHIVTNSPEHDPDVEHMPFFAISHRFFNSLRSTYYDRVMTFDLFAKFVIPYQHYLYYPILLFGRFNLYRLSWEYLIMGQGPKKGPAWWHRWLEITGQLFFWYWFGYLVVYKSIPSVGGRWAFVMISHMVTAPLHVQITLSHFAMSTADLGVNESFPQKMLRTTMDVDCPEWLDFFHGGLQFQAIHHLFPRMPRHNLRRTQKLVQEFCQEVEIPYALYGFVDGNKEGPSIPPQFPPPRLLYPTTYIPRRRLRETKRSASCRDGKPRRPIRSASESSDGEYSRTTRNTKRKVVEVPLIAIRPPPLAFPKSLYHGHKPPLPRSYEKAVLREIVTKQEQQESNPRDTDDDSFIDAELEDFVIYREHKSNNGNRQKRLEETPRANELASLHEINEWNVHLYFDGVIWYDGNKKYVQRVPCENLSIGGYGETYRPAVESDIWIQSVEGKTYNVWYRLRTPAEEYGRYHEPFLWMAQLAKHVVDFISTFQEVLLDHFREDFYKWLKSIYRSDDFTRLWLEQYGRKDFRQVLASQANFLWCQASQVDATLEKVPVWSEIHPVFLSSIPEQKERDTKADMFALSDEGGEMMTRRKTTVTPYVYNCFKHLRLAKFLYCQEPSVGSAEHYKQDIRPLSRTRTSAIRFTTQSDLDPPQANVAITVGDVVSLPQDKLTTWKSSDKEWYGYVQKITKTTEGCQLGVLWLYRPSDTPCLKVPYPFQKELFLSDHCNCGDSPIYAEEVVRRPRVAFFGEPATTSVEFFVRQKYIEGDGAWQTLQGSDFQCDCAAGKPVFHYLNGVTLLVQIKNILEPVVLVEQEADRIAGQIKVRRLSRRKAEYGDLNAEPNELVLTHRFEIISEANVYRECHVRFYSEDEKKQGKIPPPYNRQGTGDFYYITSQDLQDDDSGLQPLAAPSFACLKEGWDPSADPFRPPLKGLDMFCGGGNFGHGLEEGGAVVFDSAVDLYNEAIHTYTANLKPRNDTVLFRGSVNDYLTQAMQGKGGRVVAQRGQVEMIAAGSPCPGFSDANPSKGNDRSLLNCSLAASVVAFVDFYRPKYALMENVTGIARGSDTENMLALIISALVGMGYQVRTFGLDAWNFGSPQSRSRVFISIAAPGMIALPEPPHTHSHPQNVCAASLAKLANGLRASSRYTTPTPFKYVTAAEAINDLPATDARTSCISFPTHRMSRNLSTLDRIRIGSVPRFPGGSTFLTACDRGYMPQAQVDAYNWDVDVKTRKGSTRWQRVRRDGLMPTVLTAPHPDGVSGGTILHWDEERLLTIMEVRRAQGFDDDDVLIGLPKEQWKIVGNSVARPVALALGVSLRKAWLANNQLPETAILAECEGVRVSSNAQVPPILSTTGKSFIETSIEKADAASCSTGLLGHHRNENLLPNFVRLKPVQPSFIDNKAVNMAAETGESRQYNSETVGTPSIPNGMSPQPGDHQFSNYSKARQPSLSVNTSPRFITRETTISKVTVETTTTVVREQMEPSSEL